MIVKEMIEKLSKMPQDAIVVHYEQTNYDGGEYVEVDEISLVEAGHIEQHVRIGPNF